MRWRPNLKHPWRFSWRRPKPSSPERIKAQAELDALRKLLDAATDPEDREALTTAIREKAEEVTHYR
jgi:hypothetical protein